MSVNWRQQLIKRSRQDPVWWMENILGDQLWSRQKDVANALIEHERVAVPACHSDDTEILTEKRGWQLFKDLVPEDKVATLVEGRTVFETPIQYFEYDWEGELIGCKSKQFSFLVTPNHRLYHRREWSNFYTIKTAQELYGKGAVYFNREVNIEDGLDDEYSVHQYELWGFWCADGSCLSDFKGIQIKQKNHKEYLENLLDLTYSDYSKHDYGEDVCSIYGIYKKRIAEFFIDNFGRTKNVRSIPNWIKSAPKYKQRAFIKGFMMADGSYIEDFGVSGTGTASVSIYYERLANDFEELVIRSGYVCTCREFRRAARNSGFAKGIDQHGWLINLIQSRGNPGHTKIGKNNWFKQDYKGKVYCVETTSGIILIKHGVTCHFSGNSFGVGKTFLAARLVLWFLYNFRPSKVVSTAPTSRQVRDLLWSEIRTAHKKARTPLGGDPLQLSLKLDEDQFAVGFSTEDNNMDMFTGYHSPNQLVVFDQAGGLGDMFWDAAEGLMTQGNSKWLAISNTAISDCAFADICMPERKSRYGQWHIETITAEESPNVIAGRNIYPGLISHDWVHKRRKAWGEDDPLYKIFVKAMFVPSVQMNVVPYEHLVQAYKYTGREDDAIEIGLDVARTGLDSTVWVARSGEKALEMKRVTGNDTMTVAGETIEYMRQLEQRYAKPVRVIKVDIIGIGAGVYDRLAEQDIPALPINNAEVKVVVDKERFSNVRAEMAWAFRHRCEHRGVGLQELEYQAPELMEMLKGDLQIMKYKITSAGKIQIVSKEDIRKALGRSPDYWDALVMAYEEPGGGPPMVEFISNTQGQIISRDIEDEEWLRLIGQKIDIDDPSFHALEI